ncbi:hypothetical protein AU476_17975 [Cupriavidus sp. UYMSc13B]|nr:hypothetical protein AU476_17975 [Cupriavidus sp. UYMSc13B]
MHGSANLLDGIEGTMQMRVDDRTMLSRHKARFRLAVPEARPLARAVALLVAAGGMLANAHAAQPFSRAWMAQKNMMQDSAAATGRLPNGTPAAALTSPQAQQQRANEQLQRSIQNLGQAAQGIAAMQAAQEAARQAAARELRCPMAWPKAASRSTPTASPPAGSTRTSRLRR